MKDKKDRVKLQTGRDPELLRNASGYIDPTAYEAIKRADAEVNADTWRFHELLDTIFSMCELADFELVERIILKDKRTGKIWR